MLTTSHEPDGPYLLYNYNHIKMIEVDKAGNINISKIPDTPTPITFEVHSQEGNHHFGVTLRPIKKQPAHHLEPAKIFVVSDPHGDFDSFVAILKAGKVINDQYEWIWGKNHLVMLGDAFDRGVDVLPILWLCYKLDAEAPTHGGLFHFLIGNHDLPEEAAQHLRTQPCSARLDIELDARRYEEPGPHLDAAWLLLPWRQPLRLAVQQFPDALKRQARGLPLADAQQLLDMPCRVLRTPVQSVRAVHQSQLDVVADLAGRHVDRRAEFFEIESR